jgi:hypothetical protein
MINLVLERAAVISPATLNGPRPDRRGSFHGVDDTKIDLAAVEQ